MDKGSNAILFLYEINNFSEIGVFAKILTISTDLAISDSRLSFVPECWLNWDSLDTIFNEFFGQRRDQ